MFERLKSRYGHIFTSIAKNEDEWEFIIEDWLEELQTFTVNDLRKAFAEAVSVHIDFPPTLPNLVQLCIKASGIPSEEEIINLLVRREFNHPIVKMIYEKIGSWALKNGKSEEIKSKVKSNYASCLYEFMNNKDLLWISLKESNDQQKALGHRQEAQKPQSTEPHKSLKERLSEYQQKIAEMKLNCEGETYREFDAEAISRTHKKFDRKTYNEYRDYLLSIPEEKTLILPVSYIYDRSRFISLKEQPEYLRSVGFNPTPKGFEKTSQKRSNGPQRAYKQWNDD